ARPRTPTSRGLRSPGLRRWPGKERVSPRDLQDASGGRSFLRPGARFHCLMRVLAAVLALIAVLFMFAAIAGMVTGRPGPLAGGLIRAAALACFVAAVVLNVAAH